MNESKMGLRSRTRKLFGSALAVLGLSTVGLFGLAAPASADGLTDCPTSYVCVWDDANYNTDGNWLARVQLYYYIPVLGSHNYAGTTINANDSVSSAYNKANFESAAFFKNTYAGGSYFIFVAGQKDGDFSNGSPSGSFNDTLSSIYYCGQISTPC